MVVSLWLTYTIALSFGYDAIEGKVSIHLSYAGNVSYGNKFHLWRFSIINFALLLMCGAVLKIRKHWNVPYSKKEWSEMSVEKKDRILEKFSTWFILIFFIPTFIFFFSIFQALGQDYSTIFITLSSLLIPPALFIILYKKSNV